MEIDTIWIKNQQNVVSKLGVTWMHIFHGSAGEMGLWPSVVGHSRTRSQAIFVSLWFL